MYPAGIDAPCRFCLMVKGRNPRCCQRSRPPSGPKAQGASSVKDQTDINAALRNRFRRAEINPAILRTHLAPKRGTDVCGRLRHALAINPAGNKLEPMAENDETPTVTIEVETADTSEERKGSFKSVINVRITGSERHACELVKEAVLLAIQTALATTTSLRMHLSPFIRPASRPVCRRFRGGLGETRQGWLDSSASLTGTVVGPG